jgi:hypothetical protein
VDLLRYGRADGGRRWANSGKWAKLGRIYTLKDRNMQAIQGMTQWAIQGII